MTGNEVVDAAIEVASMSGCQSSVSGHAGVYDLSGNVLEWEDSCDGFPRTLDWWCRVRGGGFHYYPRYNFEYLRCDGAYGDYDRRVDLDYLGGVPSQSRTGDAAPHRCYG